MLNKTFRPNLWLVDFICEVTHLERASVFLDHSADAVLEKIEFVHVFADLLLLLVGSFLDDQCQLVHVALCWVLKHVPLEFTNVLCVRD